MLRPVLRRGLSALGHLYPLQTGCGKLARTRLCRWASQGDGIGAARLRNGMWLQVPLSDFVGRAVYYFGDLDPKVTWVLRRLLRPGDTVLDIGANLGLVSHYAAGLVGPRGQVHAFEPQPRLVALMEASMRANRLGNLRIHHLGLGEEAGDLDLFIPSHNYGAASFVVEAGATGERVRVPVVNASAYFERVGIGTVRLVKMDVEGFEPTVLRGAAAFFDRVGPHAVLLELNRAGHHGGNDEAVQILQGQGYVFYNLPRHALSNFVTRSGGGNGWSHDVLAVHRSHVAEVEQRLPVRGVSTQQSMSPVLHPIPASAPVAVAVPVAA
ncbi:MAG: FkbM family methyltransferase [Bacteroidota bacterium]